MRLRLPEERPAEPPTGYKIAHPVLSQDGGRVGFVGVSLGGALPYGVVDEARCVYGLRHRAPHRRCDCGFHCVHDRVQAEGLLCTAEHRAAVLLEVAVLGSYIRFERGFRYARQRVRAMTVGACVRSCGAAAGVLTEADWGGRAGTRSRRPVRTVRAVVWRCRSRPSHAWRGTACGCGPDRVPPPAQWRRRGRTRR